QLLWTRDRLPAPARDDRVSVGRAAAARVHDSTAGWTLLGRIRRTDPRRCRQTDGRSGADRDADVRASARSANSRESAPVVPVLSILGRFRQRIDVIDPVSHVLIGRTFAVVPARRATGLTAAFVLGSL